VGKTVRLRPVSANDSGAIAEIAGSSLGFTVPSQYQVWMFATTQGEFCQVAVDESNMVVGYTLGMRTSRPEVGFSWQTAVLPEFRTQHVAAMLTAHIARAARDNGMTDIRFTCPQAQADTLAKLVTAAGFGDIEKYVAIPSEWGIEEVEFYVRLK
jgi:ribosomal protein S18 acetylase RimI-like enzyme